MMLIEINLLPKKEQKKKSLFLFIFCLLILFSLLVLWFYYQATTLKEEIAKIQQNTTHYQQELAHLEKDLPPIMESNLNSIQTLKEMVKEAKQYPVNTVDLLSRMTKLLPESGYFQSFQYSEDTILLTIGIKQEMEAAFYYRHLLEEDWTEDVRIIQVSAIRDEEENLNTLSEYTAQFEIILNKSHLQKLQKEAIE